MPPPKHLHVARWICDSALSGSSWKFVRQTHLSGYWTGEIPKRYLMAGLKRLLAIVRPGSVGKALRKALAPTASAILIRVDRYGSFSSNRRLARCVCNSSVSRDWVMMGVLL